LHIDLAAVNLYTPDRAIVSTSADADANELGQRAMREPTGAACGPIGQKPHVAAGSSAACLGRRLANADDHAWILFAQILGQFLGAFQCWANQ